MTLISKKNAFCVHFFLRSTDHGALVHLWSEEK